MRSICSGCERSGQQHADATQEDKHRGTRVRACGGSNEEHDDRGCGYGDTRRQNRYPQVSVVAEESLDGFSVREPHQLTSALDDLRTEISLVIAGLQVRRAGENRPQGSRWPRQVVQYER
jgi:hypothetical protein